MERPYLSGRDPCLNAGVTDPRVPTTKFKGRKRERERERPVVTAPPCLAFDALARGWASRKRRGRVSVESDKLREVSREGKLAIEIKR